MTTHVHAWGPVEASRLTGNPHRKCECGDITLDLGDDECESCGAPLDDGEGWNGWCGNCADLEDEV